MMTPIKWQEIEDALQLLFNTSTDLDVIWEDQKAPRPSFPYGTVKMISGPTPVGIDEKRMEDPEMLVCGQREIVVSFKVFGPVGSISPSGHARAYISAFVASLEMPLYHDAFSVVGLAVRQVMPTSLPDQQIGDTWISRASCDVRFGISSNVSQPIDTIEHVHITASDPPFDEEIP